MEDGRGEDLKKKKKYGAELPTSVIAPVQPEMPQVQKAAEVPTCAPPNFGPLPA